MTRSAGIGFVHYNGHKDISTILEEAGPGCAVVDYDGDGWLDLYLTNGRDLYGRGVSARNALYRNQRDGTFKDVTMVAGVPGTGYGFGCAWGDYNNDGYPDLFVAQWGKCVLYRNRGDGTFENVTDHAGVGAMDYGESFHSSALFFDYDRDGFLDLYVCSYVKFRLDGLRHCSPLKTIQSGCPPQAYDGTPSLLFHNRGDGTFENVTRAAGLYDPKGKALSAVAADYDNDGWTDLFVAHDGEEARLFHNNGGRRSRNVPWFTNVAAEAGVAFASTGQTMAGMGIDLADYDNDGWLDAFIADFQDRPNHLWRNDSRGGFVEVSASAGIAQPSLPFLGFGAFLFDYDLDGWQDLFVANGHVYPEIEQTGANYKQRNQLFRNIAAERGAVRRFVEVSDQAGPGLRIKAAHRGASVGDYDNDGDLDILVANNDDPPTLLRNDRRRPGEAGNSAAGHFVSLQLVGTRTNRDAIGTRVTIHAGDSRQIREVKGGGSYCAHSDTRLHFGLGSNQQMRLLEVQWLGREKQQWRDVPADRFYRLVEGKMELGLQQIAQPPTKR